MSKMKIIGRSCDLPIIEHRPDRHTREVSVEMELLHPTLELENGLYLRKNEYPYDNTTEHRLLLCDWDWTISVEDIKKLQNLWYIIVFNAIEDQSQKNVFHWHCLKY